MIDGILEGLDAGFQPHPQKEKQSILIILLWMLPVLFPLIGGEIRTYNMLRAKSHKEADEIRKLLVKSNFLLVKSNFFFSM